MTVSIAGTPIQQVGSLSTLGRLALAFVDGGLDWLGWALADSGARYEFADETAMLSDVQHGLHASPFVWLPQLGLRVSPVKLMTLGLPDLRSLAQAESGDTSAVTAAQLRRILDDHHLVTQADLAAVPAFLKQLGVADSPLLQVLAFEDCLALHALVAQSAPDIGDGSGPSPGDHAVAQDLSLQKEAAAFGLQQAHTPLEFCDYYRVYLDRSERAASLSATPEARADEASTAVRALLPLLFGALDCPQVQGLPSPATVGAAVQDWLRRGRRLGFGRLSQGVQVLVRHSDYDGETGPAAQSVVRRYLDAAQAFVGTVKPMRGMLGQDGASSSFRHEDGPQKLALNLAASGVVSLSGPSID